MNLLNPKIFLISTFLFISACSSMNSETVLQGKTISAENIDQLEIGMSTEKVRLILGSPSLIETFDSNQWIYFFSKAEISEKELQEQGNLRLYFNNRQLVKIEQNGDLVRVDDKINQRGGTIITEPTQKKRGIFNR